MRSVMVLAVLCAIGTVLSGSDEQQEIVRNREIRLQDIADGKTQIIGLLGKPLGEVVELDCLYEPPKEKQGEVLKTWVGHVRILSINGEKIPAGREPRYPTTCIDLLVSSPIKKIEDQHRFQCRAYEGISSTGLPDNAFHHESPVSSGPWGIQSHLTIH